MGSYRIGRAILILAAGATTMGAMMSSKENDGRIDYVEFRANDLQRTKVFYSEVFRWRFTDYGPDYTSFADGRLTGGFHRGDPTPGGTLAVIYAVQLEAMQARIEQAGGTIVKPIFSFPGGRRLHFHDPSGNELAVWSDK
jgi:predicted enzyme related to lactoylglutathione lyase